MNLMTFSLAIVEMEAKNGTKPTSNLCVIYCIQTLQGAS